MDSYLELAKYDIQRLQTKLNELQKENEFLRAQLGQKSSDFYSRIIRFVEHLHLRECMSDVKLITPQKSFPGHKFVLEARGGDWKIRENNAEDVIVIKGAEQNVCEGLISWLYTGKLTHKNDHQYLHSMMLIANEFSVSELISQCEASLIPLLSRENCIELYSAAYVSKANRLLEHCFTLLSTVWTSVSREELSILSAPVLRSILEKQTCFPLHSSIKLGRADVAACLMDSNPIEVRILVNELDSDGLSPLYLAMADGLFDLAAQLVKSGADVNLLLGKPEEKQPTGLFAFENRLFMAVQFLIDNGMQLNACTRPAGSTLLHLLAKIGSNDKDEKQQLELARLLLKRHANLYALDASGNTPVHVCILHNSKSMFDLLLDHADLQTDWAAVMQHCSVSPLWFALLADFGQTRTQLLRSAGFDVNMFLVAPENRYSLALVEAGVPVNWVFTGCNSDPASTNIQPGETVLMTCARLGLEPAALFLLEQSVSPVDVSVCLESGATVFHLAVESELRDLCKCLVSKHDVNPNQFRSIRLTSELPTSTVSSSPVTEQQQREALKPADSSNKPMNPFDLFPDDDEKLHESGASFDPGAPQLTERMDPDGQGQPSTLTEVSGTVPIAENAPCERRTPLHLALLHEMYDLIELYLEHRARREPNWFLLDHDGESVFSLALWSTQFDLANRILIAASKSSYGRKLSSENVDDETRADVLAQFSAKSGLPTLLHRAVTRGQLETVRFLIRHGVDVNSSLSNSQSDSAIDLGTETEPNRLVCPLLTALMGGMQPIADILVARGADVDCWRAFSGTSILVTLLHRAIYERDEITAEYLIKNNCDVNAVAKCPSSGDYSVPHNLTCLQLHLAWKPIHMAASLGLLRIVQSLVKCTRTEISCQEAEGNTALHIAVRNGHDKIVTALLGCPVFDCTVKNVHGHTAFYVAMNSRNVKAAQSILERDPTLALQTDKLGRNFLHLAVQNVDAAAIFFLIQTGMDMNQRVVDANQYTPLHLAIIAGVPEDIFRSLLLAGASTEDRTTQKYTPLHLCVVHNRPELLYCLIETGANVNEQDSEMNTPLHLAVRTGHTACLTVLLSQQTTDPCIMNVRGQFPIHLLAEHNPSIAVEMLQFLFEVTVAPQINAKDASGNTPLLLAYRANNIALCIALVHAGASMGTANTDGHSVFSLSRQRTGTAAPDRILSQILDSLVQEPRWEDGLACIECNAKFGLTTRKHHCRHCGRLLCALCSNFELPIIKFGINKPVRVCETCFNFLNNPLGM